MEKRYEIFVSSTFEDLKIEREFIRDCITHNGNIPIGMEDFSGGRPSWSYIEKAITDCDYYILIVGGRYGSLNPKSPEGYSYTECEYNFARQLGKEVLPFVLSDKALNELTAEKLDTSKSKRKKLNDFRTLLRQNQVIFWENRDDLERRMLSEIPKWITAHPVESGGWVKAKEYGELKTELERIKLILVKEKSHKYVFSYLFDRLNPYENVSLTHRFLEDFQDFDDQLDSMPRLVQVLKQLIKLYIKQMIEAQIRVYFAYSLNSLHLGKDWWSRTGEAIENPIYRLGISNSKEGAWQEGNVLQGFSNIHNVYQKCDILGYKDSTKKFSQAGTLNIPVKDEGSVIAAPIYGTSSKFAVGVVGFNSPNKNEATDHRDLVKELGILFSSLFYAYGKQIKPIKGVRKDDKYIICKLRNEVAEYFNNELGEHAEQIQ